MLETKRRVIGQMIVCQGCGCGATHKDRPEVPADWLRSEWRRRGLPKRVQLSISGCVGPCDVPNVVVVNSETGSQWLGSITEFNQYQSLLEWAVRVHGCWASSQTTDGIQRAHDPALGVTGFDVGVGRSICLRLPLQNCGRIGFNVLAVIFLGHCLQRRPGRHVRFIIYPVNRFHHTYIPLSNVLKFSSI